ncbi:hypothetical protein HCBG_00301 [Histoplasma capsulatum G186AR]|uniref:Uncharacterized protein n=1 Tax=Ajellomyces capsulatus (strain G186AR / H82 / ATCC MYA-2454 / RMSCC 2432) TaxID=447093 RepID=C0NB05_AJECG|nr:uncharacterized protein HCBG_00301 [Histoplasma capsulatum G186AR]EEH10846.1 hypothetical protein HCBG_00301 [Histoplasma capsulatum G186AR]
MFGLAALGQKCEGKQCQPQEIDVWNTGQSMGVRDGAKVKTSALVARNTRSNVKYAVLQNKINCSG